MQESAWLNTKFRMGFFVVNGVVGKANMLLCVDGLEKRVDTMLKKIGCEGCRTGAKYEHDAFGDFLGLI